MGHSSADGVTYGDLLVDALTRYPDREAFVDGDRRVSYAETADLTARIMAVLTQLGVRPGSAIGALSPNVPEVWMVQAASYLIGATYTGLHPFGSADDHAFLCDDAEMEVLVVHPDFAETGAEVVERAGSLRHVLTIGPAEIGLDLGRLCAIATKHPLRRGPASPEDVAWLQYAGNTTGRPKGVMIPHRAMVDQVQSMSTSAGLPETPRYLASTPISHGAVGPIGPTLARGGTVVLHQGFDPEEWLRTVEEERINYAFMVPTLIYKLLDEGTTGKFDLSTIETIVYGASPMSPSRLAEAHEAFGPKLLQIYGQTECISLIATLRKDEHDPARHPERLASCGRPVVGARVELLDRSDQPVTDGEVGEICVRSRGVMSGYRNLPDQTTDTLRGGWLHTGEIARRDESGFIYIVGRSKDMIVTGGFNVYAREIEDAIASNPAVKEVAVIGIPDSKWGEAVCAVVVSNPGETLQETDIIESVRSKKGRHQVPKRVEIVDALPISEQGSVDKEALRERYWVGHGRRVH